MLAAFAVLLLFMGVGLVEIRNVAEAGDRKACLTALGDRVFLRNLVQYAAAGNTSDRAHAFFTWLDEQMSIPPEVCEGTGVNVDRELTRLKRNKPPIPDRSATTSVLPTVPTPGPPGPPGPPGRAGRDAPGSREPVTTTTTRPPPSTTTTTRPPCRLTTVPPCVKP